MHSSFQSGQTQLTGTAVLFARLRLNHYESGAVGIQSVQHTEYPFQIVLARLVWSMDADSAPISISGLLTAKSNYGNPFLQPLAILSQINLVETNLHKHNSNLQPLRTISSKQINLNEKSSKQTPLNKPI
jgi:hypothetical protein